MDQHMFNKLQGEDKLSSIKYIGYDNIKDYEIITVEEGYFFYGHDPEYNMKVLHFHVDSFDVIKAQCQKTEGNYLMTFIPETHQNPLKSEGFEDFVYWKDYHAERLKEEHVPLHHLIKDEMEAASLLTKSCQNQTRGFSGQSIKWIESWVNGTASSLIHSKAVDSSILVEKVHDELAGIACVGIYNNTLWIREIAVLPKHQNKGIGHKLMKQAMSYGVIHKVKKGFLMADCLNEYGDKLYKQYGFSQSEDGELNMIKLVKETSLEHYLGEHVQVVIDRKMHTSHPKFDMIYPINYGYIPYTKSGDDHEVDAYVIGPSEPVDYYEGQVIAVIHRADDHEEKLVVANKMYTEKEIMKAIEFTEKYFESSITMLKR